MFLKEGGEDQENMEIEEYEFELVFSPEKQKWVSTLVNGTYLINVKSKYFKEFNEVIQISAGSQT